MKYLNKISLFYLLIIITMVSAIGCSQQTKVFKQEQTTTTQINPIINIYEFTDMPSIFNESDKAPLLGGFSGLFFNRITAKEELFFTSVTDKLPSSFKHNNKQHTTLPFLPSIVLFTLNTTTKNIAILNVIHIKPNSKEDNQIFSHFDYEGIVQTNSNDYWVVEESIPSLLKINNTGKIIQRYVPFNTDINKLSIDIESLPEKYNHLKKNGFEGIAFNKENNKLYLFLQNKLDLKLTDFNKQTKHTTWIVEFDIDKKKVTGEYLYPSANKLKLSGATHYKNNEFLVIERIKNKITDLNEFKINKISLDNATNIKDFFDHDVDNKSLKLKNPSLIEEIHPVEIATYLNLSELGFDEDSKFEGLAYLGNNKIAIINDNDFALEDNNKSNIVIIEY